MNYIWAFMMLGGIAYAACNGTLPSVTDAALDAAKEAITLCITMLGVMSFWVGLMRIAEKSGLVKRMTQAMQKVLRFLFPHIPKGHSANAYIATNCIANILGLGWAATPAGLKAMEALENLQKERRDKGETRYKKEEASDEMCTFLVLNISSLQLIPVTIIAYRSQYGSVNPTRIVGPAILATLISTLAGILFCKIKCRKKG